MPIARPHAARRALRRAGALLGAVGLAAGLVAAGPASGAGSACAPTADGGRTSTPPLSGTIVDLEVDVDRPSRVWATDGLEVVRSDDGGCSWTSTWAVDGGLLDGEARIVELVTPPGDVDWLSAWVLAPSATLPGRVVPMVATTRDGGGEWIEVTDGLPDSIQMELPAGGCDRTCGMVGTTDGDDTVYLWFTEPAGVSVYWTLSGGRVFSVRSEPARPLRFDVRTDLPADEMVTDDPGYFGLFGVRRSEGATASDDGGRTWNEWPEHFGDFPGVEFGFPDEAVGEAADRRVDRYLVAELDPSTGVLLATHAKYSDVLGWHRAPTAGVTGRVTGMTSLGDASIVAVTTTDGVFVGEQVGLAEVVWRPLVERPGLRRAQFAGDRLWLHDGASIAAIDPDVLPRLLDLPPVPVPPAQLDLPPFDPANPYQPLPGTLEAASTRIEVSPGASVDLDLVLDVPATDARVDLVFLVARHGSMDDDLESLAREIMFIVKDLVAAGVDVNVGVGVYGSQVRYHRYRDVGVPDDEFKKVVEDIHGFGDASAAYTALDAALAGMIFPATATKFATFKGIEFHWRPNSTRLMVHVTDTVPFTDDEQTGEPGATVEDGHRALVEADVLHLGLVAGNGTGVEADDWTRMRELSAVSGALAVNPIDCNGDGITDLRPGDPIVCFLPAGATNGTVAGLNLLPGLSEVMVDLVDAATDIAPLEFFTTTPELVPVLGAADGRTTIDLKADVRVPTRASLTCGPELAGEVVTTRLSAVSGTRGLATTTLDIACGVAAVVPPAVAAPTAAVEDEPAPVEVIAPVPVVPAAAPVPVANTPASSNVLPNQGFASAEQREQQAQAAHIGKDRQRQPDAEAEFAYTRLRSREDATAPLTLAAGAAMAVGAAGALARRRRGVAVPGRVTTGR